MGYVDVQKLTHVLPDGRMLFDEVSFRVGDGAKTALVGANGTGKTTLLRMIAGDLSPLGGGTVGHRHDVEGTGQPRCERTRRAHDGDRHVVRRAPDRGPRERGQDHAGQQGDQGRDGQGRCSGGAGAACVCGRGRHRGSLG